MDIETLERKALALSELLADVKLTLDCLEDSLQDYNNNLESSKSSECPVSAKLYTNLIKTVIEDLQYENKDLNLYSEAIADILAGI